MSGYMFCLGTCIGCKRPFTFHPELVPSLRYPPPNGPREPVCADCVARVNPMRVANGLAEIHVPPGAYEPGPA